MTMNGAYVAPVWTHKVCRRKRLTNQLDHAGSRAVTLICAPPGTGKTVLVSDWVASRPDVLTTWLDIDQRTNDGDVLVQDLAVRFEALGVVAGPVESDGTRSAGCSAGSAMLGRRRLTSSLFSMTLTRSRIGVCGAISSASVPISTLAPLGDRHTR